MLKSMIVLTICLSVLSVAGGLSANTTGEFQVIVHATNPSASLTKTELARMFLKKLTTWKKNNDLVYPVDLQKDSLVRIQFSQDILGKKVAAIKAYWQQQIFAGREIPPMEKASDEEVLKYVEQQTGAIGYVSRSTDIRKYQVKVIEILEE